MRRIDERRSRRQAALRSYLGGFERVMWVCWNDLVKPDNAATERSRRLGVCTFVASVISEEPSETE